MQTTPYDVIIAGGGLAGLSLARQLHLAIPKLTIVVIERNQFPIPKTTAKVGESTVEIASHYFSHVLGLEDHFQQHHLRKYGLRCFFGHSQADYAQQDELGVSQLFGIPTYQIERGILENHLYENLLSAGVTVIDQATIKDIDIGNKDHRITVVTSQGEQAYQAPWMIDAAGRQSLIKNTLGLQKNNAHRGNAVWFRIKRKIVIDEWTNDTEWQNRVDEPGKRWLSTNHLMGPGYWVWIIPLGSEATSIGIVMDDTVMEDSNIDHYEDAFAWLEKHQPRCAQAIEGAEVLDFVKACDYSYDCKKIFSYQGWALTGEAGVFADPLYSPGSDFIAIGNTFITDLIKEDYQGKDIKRKTVLFEAYYRSFFESTLSLYTQQYGGFGDRKMMSVKLLWDFAYYWGVLSLLFFKQAITDTDLMNRLNPTLIKTRKMNTAMQAALNQRAQQRLILDSKGLFINLHSVPCLHKFIDSLKRSELTDVEALLEENACLLEELTSFLTTTLEHNNSSTSQDEKQLIGNYRSYITA